MKAMLACLLVVTACGTAPADSDAQAARAALGDPMVVLTIATVQAADSVDYVRYTAERGADMAAALGALRDAAETLRVAAADAERAVNGLAVDPGTPAATAAELVADAAFRGWDAAAALEAEARYLARLVEADEVLQDAVDAWGDPRSVDRHTGPLHRLAAELARAEAEPAACPLLHANRARWAELVAERSVRLAEAQARDAEQLREALLRQPFGEDAQAADAADRACWWRHSRVAQAAVAVEVLMEAFEETTH